MVSNQVLGARLGVGLLAFAVVSGSLALSGCSSTQPRETESVAPPPPVASASQSVGERDLTATEAAIQAQPSNEVSSSGPPPDASIINPNAPKSYVVKRGDTLWGIASMFLRDPWLWPEVWYVNPQVANPHLIYPGDTLTLAYGANGQPQIVLTHGSGARLDPRLRSDPIDGAVPTIPYSTIQAFLSRPTLLTTDQVKHAPYILAARDDHQIAGTGNEVYVRNLSGAQANARYSVVHVGDPLRDPDDGKVVGYQGIYTGTALVSRPGEVTKAVLIDTARETLRGDKVLASDASVPLNFMPAPPRTNVHGRIIAVVDGTDLIGQYQIVAINRGLRDGINNGTVLAIDRAGESVRDVYGNGNMARTMQTVGTSFAKRVKLPDERTGTMLIFRAFDRMSYALILGATDTIKLQDVVHNP